MTQAQSRALLRAQEYAIRVLAKGRVRATGQRFFITNSRDNRSQHVVLVEASTLVCDCIAGRHGQMCCHRGAVHAALVAEQPVYVERPVRGDPNPDETAAAWC